MYPARVIRPHFRCGGKGIFDGIKGSYRNSVRYCATSQLAKRWGVSAVTIIRLIEQGDLRGLKIRGSYRISLKSIEEYESRVAF